MVVRVEVRPELLEWAVDRSGRGDEMWTKSFPRERYEAWLAGGRQPTLRQLRDFANKTYAPIGFLFLDEPPGEGMPIADFRAGPDVEVDRISADLRETIYDCQDRQACYRNHRLLIGAAPLPFVGSASVGDPPLRVADSISQLLGWDAEVRRAAGNWSGALAALRDRAEAAGVLVVISGIVGANTRRKLEPDEFKGFALVDEQASLVFVNGADYEASKIFTLAHELVHVWLGATGLSDLDPVSVRDLDKERWCNRVAAELLVPSIEFQTAFNPTSDLQAQIEPLAGISG